MMKRRRNNVILTSHAKVIVWIGNLNLSGHPVFITDPNYVEKLSIIYPILLFSNRYKEKLKISQHLEKKRSCHEFNPTDSYKAKLEKKNE